RGEDRGQAERQRLASGVGLPEGRDQQTNIAARLLGGSRDRRVAACRRVERAELIAKRFLVARPIVVRLERMTWAATPHGQARRFVTEIGRGKDQLDDP